jgi:hypothetical protein
MFFLPGPFVEHDIVGRKRIPAKGKVTVFVDSRYLNASVIKAMS